MSEDKDITFQDTIEWAALESERKGTRSKGIPLFYLVIGAIIVLILLILIVYLASRNPDKDTGALDMMKDDKYVFDGEDSYGESDIVYEGSEIFEDEDGYTEEGSSVYDDPEL